MLRVSLVCLALLVCVPAGSAGAAIGDLTYAGSSAPGSMAMGQSVAVAGGVAFLAGGNGDSGGLNDGIARFGGAPPAALGGDQRARYGAVDVAATADGTSLYVAARSGGGWTGRVYGWQVGSDGTLSSARCYGETGGCPGLGDGLPAHAVALAVPPDGGDVYVLDAEAGGGRVLVLERDEATGALGTVECVGAGGGCTALPSDRQTLVGPVDVAAAPDGRHVYTTDPASSAITTFARAATGRLTSAGCVSQFGGDATEPTTSGCAAAPTVATPTRLAISPEGKDVYALTGFNASLVHLRRDPATGALTAAGCVGSMAGCTALPEPLASAEPLFGATSLTVSRDGRSVYVVDRYTDTVMAFARDGSTGAVTLASCLRPAAGFEPVCAPYTPTSNAGTSSRGAVAVAPDDRSLVVGGYTGGGIAAFVRQYAACADAAVGVATATATALPLTCVDGTGAAVAAEVVAEPAHGTLAGGSYTPDAGYVGTDALTFRAPGPAGASNTATLTITVAAKPADPPPATTTTPAPVPVPVPLPPPAPSPGPAPGPAPPAARLPSLLSAKVASVPQAGRRRTLRLIVRARTATTARATLTRGSSRVGRSTTLRVRAGTTRLALRGLTLRRGRHTVRLDPADGTTPVTARFTVVSGKR